MENLYETIALEETEKALVIHVLPQRVFLSIADKFKEEVKTILDNNPQNLIINLSRVNVMNSSGLGVLILARDRMLKKGGKLILCGLRSVMKEIFNRMQLEIFFTFADDVEIALGMLNGENKNPCMDTGL